MKAARDGMNIFVRGTLPTNKRAMQSPPTKKLEKIARKVGKVRKSKYIKGGWVSNLTDFFDVPKGEDIRIVYNGTRSGLNDALWAPSFFLPTANTAARVMSFYTYCVDLDLGEMFLNFLMDKKIRAFAGVDVTCLQVFFDDYVAAEHKPQMWERWERLFMGMKSSPYNAVRYFYWAEEFARGNPAEVNNALRYDKVVFNLPGMEGYDPSLPNVMKMNDLVDRIAGDVVTFVDDLRGSGYDMENAWQVARQIASRLQYLGIQDAPRKRRPPAQNPGAWAGCVFKILGDLLVKTVTQEKWDKARSIVNEIMELILETDEPVELDHKDLERKRGFLVHLSMTFTSMVPFLKGLHLTIDSWRTQRDSEGWKIPDKEWNALLHHKADSEQVTEEEFEDLRSPEAPPSVKSVPRLKDDMGALKMMFASETPPEVMLRTTRIAMVTYGFGDASGKGFGSGLSKGEDGISYRIGVWTTEESEESSNWREFTNVVETLEEEAASGKLDKCILYFFTDNSTVESALYKGTSSSRKLLELVIRVRLLETKHSITLHVVHVSGKRMIAVGVDGISRGLLNEGVMAGEKMLSFIPLHLTATERSPTLLPWIQSWVSEEVHSLSPYDWFQRGHNIAGWSKEKGDLFERPIIKSGVYGWFPPPAGSRRRCTGAASDCAD